MKRKILSGSKAKDFLMNWKDKKEIIYIRIDQVKRAKRDNRFDLLAVNGNMLLKDFLDKIDEIDTINCIAHSEAEYASYLEHLQRKHDPEAYEQKNIKIMLIE